MSDNDFEIQDLTTEQAQAVGKAIEKAKVEAREAIMVEYGLGDKKPLADLINEAVERALSKKEEAPPQPHYDSPEMLEKIEADRKRDEERAAELEELKAANEAYQRGRKEGKPIAQRPEGYSGFFYPSMFTNGNNKTE